jgi:folate-binding protein YgfZ
MTLLQSLRDLQQQSGAILDSETQIPLSFEGSPANKSMQLYDRSHWGLLSLKGSDRLRFLHNQTTNNIQSLAVGQGCDTVFVNSTGRTLDLATAWIAEDEVLVLVSPNRRQLLLDWMDRYLFPMDKVELADLSGQYAIFTLLGDVEDIQLDFADLKDLSERPEASHIKTKFAGIDCQVAKGTGLAMPGFTLLISAVDAPMLWSVLIDRGATPMGDRDWEKIRIQQGRPASDRELTEDYNPLEAGLWHAISFNKGCYIGQETIARLNTYKGVKQRLWGIVLDRPIDTGTALTLNGEKVGILTSCLATPTGALGLGYLRTKAGEAGLEMAVGESTGKIIAVPYLRHDYYQS